MRGRAAQETREAIEEARGEGRHKPRSAVSVSGKANVGAAVLAHAIRQIRFLEHKKQRQRLLEDGYADESAGIRRAPAGALSCVVVRGPDRRRRRDIDECRLIRQKRIAVNDQVGGARAFLSRLWCTAVCPSQ